MSTRNGGSTNSEGNTNRLEALSDGVIAVAITLLVLDVHVPDVKSGLISALLAPSQLASYLGYVTSFLVIGIFWTNHHNIFKYIRGTDHFFLLINTLFLMCVVFIPFATELLTRYVPNEGEKHTAAIVYSLTLLLNGIMFNVIWLYASGNHRLVHLDLDPQVIRRTTRNYLIGLPLYLFSLAVSLVSVETSLAIYILVALLYALPSSWLRIRRQRDKGEDSTNSHQQSNSTSLS